MACLTGRIVKSSEADANHPNSLSIDDEEDAGIVLGPKSVWSYGASVPGANMTGNGLLKPWLNA